MTDWHDVVGHVAGKHLLAECTPAWCGWQAPDPGIPLPPALDAESIRADERRKIAAMLRRAGAGRREYTSRLDEPRGTIGVVLAAEAASYDTAAGLAEDPAAIIRVIPSWQWTPEENARVSSRADGEKEA